MRLSPEERRVVARRRLILVLRAQKVCLARTLEQKISDAGPNWMRINPHILTSVRQTLEKEEVIGCIEFKQTKWYYLIETNNDELRERFKELNKINSAISDGNLKLRIGQAAEIAVYRALISQEWPIDTFGAFLNLDEHDDSTLYKKEEPPSSVSGKKMRGRADFILSARKGGLAAIEVKNTRPWIYPNSNEIKELLDKAISIDAVPILIARRISYVAFKLLYPCGVILHENYNQIFPDSAQSLADLAKHKNLLGFHDIRTGNEPDSRMMKFISNSLPDSLHEARDRFMQHKSLLKEFARDEITRQEFSDRVLGHGNYDSEDW